MEKLKRRIIFWLLAGLFIMTAFYVILYASGYRFDFKSGIFVHSGSITIKSNPTNANVDVNGELFASKKLNRINSSYSLGGLLPREYELTVGLDGFKTWSKKVDVHSGVSSEFWNIILVRNEYERTAYDASGIKKFFISPKSERLVFVQDVAGGISSKILNIEDNTIENNFTIARWNFINDSRKENIEWSPQEDYLSLPVQSISKNENDVAKYAYFILSPDTNESFNLNDFLGVENINRVRWDPKDKQYLFFLSEGSLYRANIEEKNNVTLIAGNVANFDLSKTNVYYLQLPNNLVFKASLDGQSQKEQITEIFPDISTADNVMFVVYDDSRIAFIDKNKNLVLFNDGSLESRYFNRLAEDVEGIQFSDDGKKMLYWTENEASVFYLTDWGVQPFRSRNSVENITRYSEQMKNIQWFNKDYEHVIFSIGSQVKIVELDPRGQKNCFDLIKTNIENPFLIYNNTIEKLLFIDDENSANNLFSIVFPEETNILGL